MAIITMEAKVQLLRACTDLELQAPEFKISSNDAGLTVCEVTLFLSNEHGDPINKNFTSLPTQYLHIAEDIVCEMAIDCIKTHYASNLTVQQYLKQQIYKDTKKAWEISYKVKSQLLLIYMSDNSRLHDIAHNQGLVKNELKTKADQLTMLNDLYQSLANKAAQEMKKLREEITWQKHVIQYLETFKDIRPTMVTGPSPSEHPQSNSTVAEDILFHDSIIATTVRSLLEEDN